MARCPDCIHQYCCKYDRFFGVNEVENKCIYFKPTADVAEVKHGEWKIKQFALTNCFNVCCSECGYKEMKGPAWNETFGMHQYCPNCGAKMDKKESEGFSDV